MDTSAEEELCMVGDVNIFLTDPTDTTLAELEIMIAGDAQRFIKHLQSVMCMSICLHCFPFYSMTIMNYLVFPEPSYRGKGIGKEVTRMMMCYGEQIIAG